MVKSSFVIILTLALSGLFGYVLYAQGARPENIFAVAIVLVMFFIASVAFKIMYYFKQYPTTTFVLDSDNKNVYNSVYNPTNIIIRQNYIMFAYYDSLIYLYLTANTVLFYLVVYHQSFAYGLLLFISTLFGSLYIICGQIVCGYSSHLEKQREKVPS